MNNGEAIQKKRETWGDVIRGICSLCVILVHVPGTSDVLLLYIAPFTLPCFFVLTGYFTKNYGGSIADFLYNKVLKELLLKLMFCFSLTTLSLKIVAGLILHPSKIPEWLYDTLISFLLKPVGNFFSILVVCSLLFMLINKICRDKPLPMIAAGIILAAVGYAVIRPKIIRLWNWDTAFICFLFYIIGYCAKRNGLISKFDFKLKHTLISGIVFFTLATVFGLTLGVENVRIIVANNTFHSPFVSVPLFITGILFMIFLANTVPTGHCLIKLLMYIGRHSMVYFMIGGPVIAYIHYFNMLAYEALHWSFLNTAAFKMPFYLILTAVITLIPFYLSDKYLPALNGSFRMPKDLIKNVRGHALQFARQFCFPARESFTQPTSERLFRIMSMRVIIPSRALTFRHIRAKSTGSSSKNKMSDLLISRRQRAADTMINVLLKTGVPFPKPA